MKKRAITMTQREILTTKARAAIELYAQLRADGRGGRHTLSAVVGYVLEAERMTRERLYNDLAGRGYVWRDGYWRKARRPIKPSTPKPGKPKASRPTKSTPTGIPDDPALLLEMIRNGQVPVRAAKSIN